MKETVTMDRFTCDGCNRVVLVEPDSEPPNGYHMKVAYISDRGGDAADDIYACSDRCISRAVIRGLARDDRADQ